MGRQEIVLKTTFLAITEWVLVLAALAGFTITETYQPYVTAGLVCLAAAWIVRRVRTGRFLPFTGLELPLLLFIFTAAVAAGISYNLSAAGLQFARILAGVTLFYAIAEAEPPFLTLLAAGFVFAAAGLALYFPTQHNFTLAPAKVGLVNSLGLWINANLPAPPGPSIHNNVAAGTLALALPFGMALSCTAFRRLRSARSLTSSLAAGAAFLLTNIILAGLILTTSRGAWLGTAGAACLGLLAWVQTRRFPGPRAKPIFWSVTLLSITLISVMLFSGTLLSASPQLIALQNRGQIWVQALPIIRDYPFTGSGLMAFPMVHAIYGILIHNPYLDHSHNTFLQVWIDQGLFGLLALLWIGALVFIWIWRALERQSLPLLGLAGLLALVAITLHGIYDVVFYVERTLPLTGLALGFGWHSQRPAAPGGHTTPPSNPTERNLGAVFIAAMLLLSLFSFSAPLNSAWHANLGAIWQANSELSIYNPLSFDTITLDQVRREANLELAEAHFKKALVRQPDNPTALQRLAAIALSRGDYDQALEWIKTAWEYGHRDDRTRLLLGDALVAIGQPEMAAEILSLQGSPGGSHLVWAEQRLLGQAWYRYWLPQDYQRARDAWKTVLVLNPSSVTAEFWLAQAQEQIEKNPPSRP